MNAIFSIATTTLNEAIRRRVLLIILFIGALLISVVPALGVLSVRSEMSTTISTMYAVLRFTSALIAVVLTIYMIPNEIERRTIYTILCKPVQRWQFLLGKYLGAVFALGLMLLLMSCLMLIMFFIFKQPDMAKMREVAIQPIFYFMEMSLLAAVAIFFSTFTPPLVNFFLSIGFWGIGSVLNPLYASIKSNSGTNPVMKGVADFVTTVLPNFQNYDVKNPILNPQQVIESEQRFYIYITFYAIAYITVMLVGGIIIFDKREV